MNFPKPVNRFEPTEREFSLSEKLYDFQRLMCGAHIAESRYIKNKNPVDIPISSLNLFHKYKGEIEEFLEWLTDYELRINFIQGTKQYSQQKFVKLNFDYVSLYSGGLDSGALPLVPDYKNKTGLLHHTHTSNRMLYKAREIFNYCSPPGAKLIVTRLNLASMIETPVLHTRGLSFLTNLLCIAEEFEIKKVVIPENGPLMINYPVSSIVTPTRTADPDMIKRWTAIFRKISGSNITVETPFLDKTKSEIILMSGKEEIIRHSWSCSTHQGISKMCGICLACFIRILSLYAIGKGEELDTNYETNPFKVMNTTLKETNMKTFRILLNALEFWRNLIDPELATTDSQKETSQILRNEYSVFQTHAIEMYIGIMNLRNKIANDKILGRVAIEYLDNLDKRVLQKRVSHLEKQKEKYGWN